MVNLGILTNNYGSIIEYKNLYDILIDAFSEYIDIHMPSALCYEKNHIFKSLTYEIIFKAELVNIGYFNQIKIETHYEIDKIGVNFSDMYPKDSPVQIFVDGTDNIIIKRTDIDEYDGAEIEDEFLVKHNSTLEDLKNLIIVNLCYKCDDSTTYKIYNNAVPVRLVNDQVELYRCLIQTLKEDVYHGKYVIEIKEIE